ncbi:GcrA family cell cycle regulator [Bradyrhizobium sp. SZCCHNR3015]|uniref:GcrA family cell cycle regulator n=1 Tax=Bradyrhizobium sp. SZCCHNR3015 TaxID=3057395 RepID=UPI002916B6B5|nr:GcrA family cell cycle regulator [Bradyrhizobium sp. SZCCHNR3015]
MAGKWTDERTEQLKKLWAGGLSASQIAAELGGITRNAVIAKAARLGLSPDRLIPRPVYPPRKRRPLTPPILNSLVENSLIQRRPEPPPVVPTLKPAAIEPMIRKGKITLPNQSVKSDLDERTIQAALRALRQQVKELADDLAHAANADHSQNIDKRVVSFLQNLSNRIPTRRPTQEALFLLGHEQETLETYAATVNEEWPPLLSGRYLSVTRAFDRTLRQFPKWRLFKRNAGNDRLTTEQRERAPELAAEFSFALGEKEAQEQIDHKLPETIDALRGRLSYGITNPDQQMTDSDEITEGSNALAEDLITSIDNIVKLIADIALAGARALVEAGVGSSKLVKDAASAFWKTARPSIIDSAGAAGKTVGPKLVLWCKRILVGATTIGVAKVAGLSAVIARLIVAFPDTFGWVTPILRFLQLF